MALCAALAGAAAAAVAAGAAVGAGAGADACANTATENKAARDAATICFFMTVRPFVVKCDCTAFGVADTCLTPHRILC